jgi:hypothetical protein
MRVALVLVVVVAMATPVAAQSASRAESVVDALGVDEPTASKLIDIVSRYDLEIARLQRQRAELKRQLVTAHHLDRKSIDHLLDEALANQRGITDAEGRLIARVRQIVPARKAVQLLVLLSVTEPSRSDAAGETDAVRPHTAYDPEALCLPGARTACDPFASMHGCRYK